MYSRLTLPTCAAIVLATASACGGSRSAPGVPAAGVASVAATSVEDLYEAGRYEEAVRAVAASGERAGAKELWLAADSYAKLGREGDARGELNRLAASNDPAWSLAARLAIAGLDANTDAFERVRPEAEAYSTHPGVQFVLGVALAGRGDVADAARAFDRCIAADPDFAYAYYHAGLAYERLGRADLVANRFETFVRLAPQAPERPGVESILRTVRGR